MWAGQAAALGREMPAAELVAMLMDEARTVLAGLASGLPPDAGARGSGSAG